MLLPKALKKALTTYKLSGLRVPEAGIEPALLAEHEFESCASTSSATQAFCFRKRLAKVSKQI